MRETQGERVSATELLNRLFTCLQNAAVTGCKRGKKVGLGEVSWRTTMESKSRKVESQRVQKFLQQVRRQEVSRRYHEQEIGVFVGTCPISAPGAPCLIEWL